jgi:hypothetical protein
LHRKRSGGGSIVNISSVAGRAVAIELDIFERLTATITARPSSSLPRRSRASTRRRS